MIKIVKGNIFSLKDTEALVDPVNCVGIAGAGLAKAFREKFPEEHLRYVDACKSGMLRSGKVFVCKINNHDKFKYIVYFPTKRHWTEKSTISMVTTGLLSLVQAIKQNNIKSIAIPRIGCGLGGLSWNVVLPLIRSMMKHVDADILIIT